MFWTHVEVKTYSSLMFPVSHLLTKNYYTFLKIKQGLYQLIGGRSSKLFTPKKKKKKSHHFLDRRNMPNSDYYSYISFRDL